MDPSVNNLPTGKHVVLGLIWLHWWHLRIHHMLNCKEQCAEQMSSIPLLHVSIWSTWQWWPWELYSRSLRLSDPLVLSELSEGCMAPAAFFAISNHSMQRSSNYIGWSMHDIWSRSCSPAGHLKRCLQQMWGSHRSPQCLFGLHAKQKSSIERD